MTAADIHLERVAPGLAPRGIFVRICAGDRLLAAHSLLAGDDALAAALRDAEIVNASAAEEVRSYFYDGDTGECLCTIITRERRSPPP
jgi:hypothetical protein